MELFQLLEDYRIRRKNAEKEVLIMNKLIEIKQRNDNFSSFIKTSNIKLTAWEEELLNDVLALIHLLGEKDKALEETQEQLRRTQITSSVHEGNSDAYFAECERLRGELANAQQLAELACSAYEGLQVYNVSRGEYDSLLNKHTVLAKALCEAQQTITSQGKELEQARNTIAQLWERSHDL